MALIAISGFSKNLIESSFDSDSFSNVEFDGYLNVTPVTTNVITRRPVEDGFDLNDAVHNTPTLLSVEIIITDTAQTLVDTRAITNIGNITGSKFFQTHTKKQLNAIQDIINKRGTVNLKTKYSEYNGYLIENLSYTETDEQALRITFNMVEVRTDVQEEATDNIDDSIGLWS